MYSIYVKTKGLSPNMIDQALEILKGLREPTGYGTDIVFCWSSNRNDVEAIQELLGEIKIQSIVRNGYYNFSDIKLLNEIF